MAKISFLTIVILLCLTTAVPAKITLYSFEDDQGEVWTSGNIVARYENWSWFQPSPQPNDNNDYDYYWIRSRLGIGLKYKHLESFLQIQDTHIWDLPDNAGALPPAGGLGLGAVYYGHLGSRNAHGTFVKQGYLKLNDVLIDGFSLLGGRFEYSDGLEVTYNNPKVMWLKKTRLSERLIGPFGWSAFTRSYDGGQIIFDKNIFNVTAMISHPTEGGFENDGHHQINDIYVAATSVTLKHDSVIPQTENRFFYYFYDDDRKAPKADNTPAGSDLNQGNIEIFA